MDNKTVWSLAVSRPSTHVIALSLAELNARWACLTVSQNEHNPRNSPCHDPGAMR